MGMIKFKVYLIAYSCVLYWTYESRFSEILTCSPISAEMAQRVCVFEGRIGQTAEGARLYVIVIFKSL